MEEEVWGGVPGDSEIGEGDEAEGVVAWEEGRYALLGQGRGESGIVGGGSGRVHIVSEARCT